MPCCVGKFVFKTLAEQRALLLKGQGSPFDMLCNLHAHRVPSYGQPVGDASRICRISRS